MAFCRNDLSRRHEQDAGHHDDVQLPSTRKQLAAFVDAVRLHCRTTACLGAVFVLQESCALRRRKSFRCSSAGSIRIMGSLPYLEQERACTFASSSLEWQMLLHEEIPMSSALCTIYWILWLGGIFWNNSLRNTFFHQQVPFTIFRKTLWEHTHKFLQCHST